MEFNVIQMPILNFFQVRLNKMIVNLRKFLIDFLFDPKSPHKGLEMFESHFVNNHVITSESLSHYVCGAKPSTKNKLFSWVINFIFWINFIVENEFKSNKH